MANPQLFGSAPGKLVPRATAINEAGGAAYLRHPESALALYAATGCLNGVYYASEEAQLDEVLSLCGKVSAEFVVKTAIYARRHAHMKDMPALLMAHLATRDGVLLERAFDAVIDNGRMLRNFVQIIRSGVTGRKSLGTRPKRLVKRWLETASVDRVMSAAIGERPSLADVIRMVHPKPKDAEREALYAWLIGRPHKAEALPQVVQAFEAFKQQPGASMPDLPFQYLTALPLSAEHWKGIARWSTWQATRMNLNTFLRHGVFEDAELVAVVAARLRDGDAIAKARVFPYQLLTAYHAAKAHLPEAIAGALQDAMEIATQNVPVVSGNVVIAVDVSDSMTSPVTGRRKGATSAIRCVDVAALVAACLKRANPSAVVMPFADSLHEVCLDPRDSVMAQAKTLAGLLGGGTNVSAPLASLNAKKANVDLLVIVSDNQSWLEGTSGRGTETMRQWSALKGRCPAARMVCIDLQPYGTSQTVESDDVLHVGGFGDAVFEVLSAFSKDGSGGGRWAERIEAMTLQ